MHSLQRILPAILAALFLAAPARGGDPLPRPQGLETEIGFWRQIFADCTTEQGLVHDNRYLGVVYEKLDLSGGYTPARLERAATAARDKYQRILRALAAGPRTGLDPESARVLSLWPAGVTDAELREAADRVRFQQGLAERFHAGLVRSGLWRDHIRRSLRAAGVPEDVEALPHVESSFDPNARSFVGAAGLWQFTGDTGRRFLRIDQAVDERRDPYESSDAAARLLKFNYDALGTWPLAITAYNHGTAGMRRAVDQTGTTDIETIIRRYDGRSFGFASRNFYVSFLAALDIEKNPEKFFGAVRRQAPRPELVVELPDYMHVGALEKAFGVSRSTLQAYNPALLPPVWEGAKYVPRGFRLRLPASGVIEAAPEEILAGIPRAARFDSQARDASHRVKRGDTLSGIAQRYGMSITTLARANDLKPTSRIRIGQVLKLPGRAPPAPVARAEAAAPAGKPPASGGTYRVQPGDSLGSIAARTGVSQRDLVAWNAITDADRVVSGTTLRLAPPGGDRPAAADPQPPALASAGEGAPARSPPRAPAGAGAAGGPGTGQDRAGTSPDVPGAGPASRPDPTNYRVADDDSVEVQAGETLSHYADWLEVGQEALLKANGWSARRSLALGERLHLVFGNVSRETFLSRRVAFHHDLQEAFFSRYRIADTTEHKLRPGESVWALAAQRYKVPVWLLRQYNPSLDLAQVRPGTLVVFPRLVRVALDGDRRHGGTG